MNKNRGPYWHLLTKFNFVSCLVVWCNLHFSPWYQPFHPSIKLGNYFTLLVSWYLFNRDWDFSACRLMKLENAANELRKDLNVRKEIYNRRGSKEEQMMGTYMCMQLRQFWWNRKFGAGVQWQTKEGMGSCGFLV